MKIFLHRFFASTEGATAIEYGLIASIVALGIISSLMLMGSAVEGWYLTVVEAFPD
jgi:pilus assembly protein Flp/PilA